jgi:hypothetical protein
LHYIHSNSKNQSSLSFYLFIMNFIQQLYTILVLSVHVLAQASTGTTAPSVTVVLPGLSTPGAIYASIVSADASTTVMTLFCVDDPTCQSDATLPYTAIGTTEYKYIMSDSDGIDNGGCIFDPKTGATCSDTYIGNVQVTGSFTGTPPTVSTTSVLVTTFPPEFVVPMTIPVSGGAGKLAGATTSQTSTTASQTSASGSKTATTSGGSTTKTANAAGMLGVETWAFAVAGVGAVLL